MAFHPLWIHKFETAPDKWVFVPSDEARKTGSKILERLAGRWTPPTIYCHMHPGGHVKASAQHTKHDFFACLDLKGFFNSINRSRVTRVLKPFFGYSDAREMAKDSVLTIFRNGAKTSILPFGFVQSPMLASLCLDKSALGSALLYHSRIEGLTISVYVDDIIVSSPTENLVLDAVSRIRAASERSGFAIHEEKSQGPAAIVQAFNLEISNSSLRVTAKRMEQFRTDYLSSASDAVRRGIESYVRSINEDQAGELANLLASDGNP